MRLLLHSDTGELSFHNFSVGETIPPYAILSHTWGADAEEVTFEDLLNGTGKGKPGYEKIEFCGGQAREDGLQYFWVDTCCINKTNKAELSDSINSMFRYYRNSTRCYVYLSDVSIKKRKRDISSNNIWESGFRRSKWFTRGWTLQELLASRTVEFFSREGNRLGDKDTLEQQIHEITGVPKSALQGTPLPQFSVHERLSWSQHRETKYEEDKAYSLLGIFDVRIAPIYGEGMGSSFKRLQEEIEKLEKCVQDIRITDPRLDKKRIEDAKGGLLADAYDWILQQSDYQQWRYAQQNPLLWIKGDPGKGKTMLLCGIIDELNKSVNETVLLSYFFCQATDSRINNATAVLRSLIYLLIDQRPSLVSHVRKKYDQAGKSLFEDTNTWVALSEIFTNILQDPSLDITYLIIDALDECVADLPKLLDFIAQQSTVSSRVKWIVSSRNWPDIEELLDRVGQKVRLCLELNAESVSTAVSIYIQHKVLQLAKLKKYDDKTRLAVLQYLISNANDTFLWVALVCQNLAEIPRRKTLAKLNTLPPGLDSLYQRMMEQICNSEEADLCKQILASTTIAYRPITLEELIPLVGMLEYTIDDPESLREVVSLCGSFLTIQEEVVYFVHQSAKDYLFVKAVDTIFPSGLEEAHHKMLLRSLQILSKTLRRDMYSLCALGYPIEQVKQPEPDPLAASRYACIYWVDHLCDWKSNCRVQESRDLQDGGTVEVFMREKHLYWLEALSLCRSMSAGVLSMARFQASLSVSIGSRGFYL
jgi:hypothetical protein